MLTGNPYLLIHGAAALDCRATRIQSGSVDRAGGGSDCAGA